MSVPFAGRPVATVTVEPPNRYSVNGEAARPASRISPHSNEQPSPTSRRPQALFHPRLYFVDNDARTQEYLPHVRTDHQNLSSAAANLYRALACREVCRMLMSDPAGVQTAKR